MPPSPEARLPFVLTLAALTAVSATAVDVCIPAQPAIAASLGARPEAGGIIVSTYLLGYGAGQLLWGPLADRFGRRGPLVLGLLGFVATSLACGAATSLPALAALRATQGVFGGAGPVIARALARDLGGGRATARLLATISIIFGAAPLGAPLVGSGLLLVAPWPALFFFLGAFGTALLIAVLAFVPAGAARPARRGAVLASLGPLLRHRDFQLGAGLLSLVFFGYSTLLGSGSAMTQERYGVPPEAFGPLFAVAAAAAVLGPWTSRRVLADRPPEAAIGLGIAVLVGAAGTLLLLSGVAAPLWLLWAAVFTYVLAFGMLIPVTNAIALEPAGEAAGLASSLLGVLPTLAGAGGAALASSPLFDSSYQAICLLMGSAGFVALGLWLLLGRGRAPLEARG